MNLNDNGVIVVTGASRGAGKGIALALAAPGRTLYITGRSVKEGDAALPGTLGATAAEIEARGARAVPVVVDHADDRQVKALFEQVEREQGRLDLLVNNACAIPAQLTEHGGFWEKSLDMLDILNVGMRSHYVASYYAAPIMVRQGRGLIVMTSSPGGQCYMHGPAYGAGKAGVDKMAHDMAIDLKPHGVSVVSIWMGLLKTERTMAAIAADPVVYGPMLENAESAEFTGRVINALVADASLLSRSGRTFIGAELAQEYGVVDIDGRQPPAQARMLANPPVFSEAVIQ